MKGMVIGMVRIHMIAEKRELKSKGYLHQLRRDGKVPGVLHNHSGESVPIVLEVAEVMKAIHSTTGLNTLLDLEITGAGKAIALIEGLTRDMIKPEKLIHIDMRRVKLKEVIHVQVPIALEGQEKRLHDGGIVSHALYEVQVESTPAHIPGRIHVDISKLLIGDTILLKEIPVPDGCKWITGTDEVVVSILHPKSVVEEVAAAPATSTATAASAGLPETPAE